MKKIFYCFLLLTFFVLSCSKEEADMDGSQNKETENKEINDLFIFCFFILATIHIGLFFGARQDKEGK